MKTVITTSEYTLLYAPILVFLIEKPPVPAVPSAWMTESYTGIPDMISKIIWSTVMAEYITYSIFTVCPIFGTSFPGAGPGLSATSICTVFAFTDGSIASISASTPIPPTQCVKLLQNSMPLGRLSMSVRIDAPVVEKPETDSKKASIGEEIAPLIKNGNAPKIDINSQDSATVANPSLAYIWSSFGLRRCSR